MSPTIDELPAIGQELLKAARAIRAGQKGKDYLNPEGCDDLAGWSTTLLETAFYDAAKKLREIPSASLKRAVDTLNRVSKAPSKKWQLILAGLRDIIHAFVDARVAADTTRARLMAYAGDYGDVISAVGEGCGWINDFFESFTKIASTRTRECLAALVGKDYLEKYAAVCTWISAGDSAEFSVKISKILQVESPSERLAREGNDAVVRVDYTTAKRAFQEAIKLDRNNAAAHLGLGKVAFAEGQYKEAQNHLSNAKGIDPRDAESARLYVEVCQVLKETRYIEYAYRDWLARAPKDLDALYGMAQVFISQKNYVGAQYFLSQMLDIDPTNEKAKAAIARLPKVKIKK